MKGDKRSDAEIEAEAIKAVYPYGHPSVSALARHLWIGTPRMRRIVENSEHLYTKQGRDILKHERIGDNRYISGIYSSDRFLIQEYCHYIYLYGG